MKISEILKEKKTFSFEVFPPKEEKPMEPLIETLKELYRFKPDFISCTYGAGGTNKGRNLEVCRAIEKGDHQVLSHFTCIGGTKDQIRETMKIYEKMNIKNVLALRGDIPEGWEGTKGDFNYGDELIEFIKAEAPELSIGVAAYPEKHIEAKSMEEDIEHLKSKIEKGGDFIMTQLCHDVTAFEKFVDKIRGKGITVPIIVGIMPILFREGAIRMSLSNGVSIPRDLAEIMGRYEKNKEDFKKAGKEYTVKQIDRYKRTEIAGIHVYSMNKHEDLIDILLSAGLERE